MRLRSLPIKDVRNIVMSLVIAIAVWFYAYSSSLATRISTVRVNIVAKSGWMVTRVTGPSGRDMVVKLDESAGPQSQETHVFLVSVEVMIQYPRRSEDIVQEAIQAGKIYGEITIDAPTEDEEREKMPVLIFPADFKAPSGLGASIIKVLTPRLFVSIAQEETRQDVPVEPVVVATPPGTRVDSKWPTPDRVAITGPRSVVQRLDKIKTEPIDIRGAEPTFNKAIPVSTRINERVVLDGVERRVRCNTAVECTIYLAPQPVEKEFTGVPIMLLTEPGFPYDVRIISSGKINVRVSGSPAALANLTEKDILLFVDVNAMDRKPGPQYRDVLWKVRNVPAGETVTVKQPEQVGVELTPKSAAKP
ncbi:MAG TPA: CdaR family protein [Candidatus Brocadiia bacterium]|nr:CdaR family protein [Candidatus Brocadiia bacterium]